MSKMRLIVDYDNEDIASLTVAESCLLEHVCDIQTTKSKLVDDVVKKIREDKTVKAEEEPKPEPQPEDETGLQPEVEPEVSEAELDEAIAGFARQ